MVWALLGLMAVGENDSDSMSAGNRHLIEQQKPDGGWFDPEFTAAGFPRVFYLRYDGYSRYFPLRAPARYRNRVHGAADRGHG